MQKGVCRRDCPGVEPGMTLPPLLPMQGTVAAGNQIPSALGWKAAGGGWPAPSSGRRVAPYRPRSFGPCTSLVDLPQQFLRDLSTSACSTRAASPRWPSSPSCASLSRCATPCSATTAPGNRNPLPARHSPECRRPPGPLSRRRPAAARLWPANRTTHDAHRVFSPFPLDTQHGSWCGTRRSTWGSG